MKNSVNKHMVALVFVKDGVRKTADKSAAEFFKDFSIKLRISTYGQDASLRAAQKFFTQTRFLSFIPIVSFGCILFGFGKNSVFLKHVVCGFSVSHLPMRNLILDSSGKFVSDVSILPFANRGQARLRDWRRCCPINLQPVEGVPGFAI